MLTFSEPRSRGEIEATFPLVAQLQPGITREDYPGTVASLMREGAFRLVALHSEGKLAGMAGYRCVATFQQGKALWIDALVIDAGHRGEGLGSHLLWWLEGKARQEDCRQLHLLTDVVGEDAHRFCFMHNFGIEFVHLRRNLVFGDKAIQ
jgi:GNAT superfamily N-acetyltransferase